ncbi:MAG: ATP-binding cassette domain-containing protein [Bryobacteraceae bacterium]
MSRPVPVLDYHNVTVIRKQRRVLQNLNLQVHEGQHVAILGPNGCGKSSLIKTITRELYPDPSVEDSWLEIFGQRRWNIFELRPMLGIVSYDWVEMTRREETSREIVLGGFHGSIGIWGNHRVTKAMERQVREVMETLEIAHLADRPTEELSSGEARRVLIARSLVHRPRALIFDEPTNSLDIHATHGLRDVLRKLAGQGITIILVTHHLPDIIPEIDRVVLLGGGRILADGTKQDLLTSHHLGELFGTAVEVVQKDGYFHAW